MAESNQRSYRYPAPRSAQTPPAQAEDPLAELARLIGQSIPMNDRDARAAAPATSRRMRDANEAAEDGYAAPEALVHQRREEPRLASDSPLDQGGYDQRPYSQRGYEQDFEPRYVSTDEDQYESSLRAGHAHPAAHPAAYPARSPRHESPASSHEIADEAYDLPHEGMTRSEFERGETADRLRDEASLDVRSSNPHDDGYRYDRYEDEEQAASDDHPYTDEYEEDRTTGRRGGFIFVAAVFALALLGTAGAFGYRAIFSGSMLPSLPPIIKAEGGPNKIMPNDTASQRGIVRQADGPSAGSGERLVSREEQPVDVPAPPVTTAPRSVSTVPILPDQPPPPGLGSATAFPSSPAPSAPPARVDTASAQPIAPTANLASGNAVAASPWPAAPATSSAAPGPKKIRTVSIRTDQANGGDTATIPPPGQGVPLRPSSSSVKPAGTDATAPLSIVPSTGDGASAAAAPRSVPARPAPLNKPPANEAASAPVTGGGYAVQISSQRSEAEAQSSFRDLQAKYPSVLGGRQPMVRRADLGEKGVYYRAMVGPFASADQATELCSNLKAAGGSCIVQKN
jgi:hypothetical protein